MFRSGSGPPCRRRCSLSAGCGSTRTPGRRWACRDCSRPGAPRSASVHAVTSAGCRWPTVSSPGAGPAGAPPTGTSKARTVEVCMLTEADCRALADRLRDAERDRAPIPPLVHDRPELTAADAYAIQLFNIHRRGGEVVGHKVGLSSAAMQQMMGVDEPDYGHLMADMRLSEEQPADASRYCYPRVEIEVAFLLGADLPGLGCTEADVLAATEAFAPSIELIDSRIRDWKISLADTIADNASSAGFVVGAARVPPKR